MACAPWLPPNTSRVGFEFPVLDAISKKACRTGTPVTTERRNRSLVSSKCTAAAETQGPIRRLARPGTTLGSNARVGMRIRVAASMAGPEAYPPTPITTWGRNSERIRRDSHTDRGKSKIVLMRFVRVTFFNAPTSISRSGKPAAGTRRFSIPREVLRTVWYRSEEHTSELQSRVDLVCRLLLEKKK